MIKEAFRQFLAALRRAMEILKQDGREVVKFETPSGVTGVVATSIPTSALEALAKKLSQRLSAANGPEATPPVPPTSFST